MSEPEVLLRVEGRVGRVTLNRPQALHALTRRMCAEITDALLAWKDDPDISCVLLDHSGPRGFCAGGDIRMLAASGRNDGAEAEDFFRTEYRLNHLLFHYPKPTLAIMDGVTMGGGVGLARPCRFRIATERTTFAMPETSIGLFPDVGGGWYLSRMPGNAGRWLGLTGARLKGSACCEVGIATHYLESSKLSDLISQLLAAPEDIAALLVVIPAPPSSELLASRAHEIEHGFAGESVAEISEALAAGSDWQQEQMGLILRACPRSVAVTLQLLQKSARLERFADNMALEYRLAIRMVRRDDFQEGVRAVIIEKDNAPRWSPASLAAESDTDVHAMFEPLELAAEWSPLECLEELGPSTTQPGDEHGHLPEPSHQH